MDIRRQTGLKENNMEQQYGNKLYREYEFYLRLRLDVFIIIIHYYYSLLLLFIIIIIYYLLLFIIIYYYYYFLIQQNTICAFLIFFHISR